MMMQRTLLINNITGVRFIIPKNAKVYAANKGTVVLAKESLGIIGVVIIDHGLGFILQSFRKYSSQN